MALQNDEVDFDAYADTVEAGEKNNAQNNQNQKGFPTPDCAQVGNKAIVRFVNGIAETALDQGKPGSGRAKLFNIGWVKDDNNKAFFLTLPAIINNKPMYKSTMVEFIDKVLSRTWIDDPNPEESGKKGEWKYFYADRNDYGQQQSGEMTLKDIYQKVAKSGVDPTSQFYKSARSWRGQTVYVANVIDRLDYKWHQEHKTTKLLMKKITVKTDGISRKEVSFFAMGSPLKELTDNHGAGLNYDVMIIPGKENTDKYKLYNVTRYKVKDFWDDVKNIITEDDKAKVSTEPGFTQEEATWDPIDIDKFYRITPSRVILAHFGKTIKAFDMMTGSDFYGQFEAEAALEKKFDKKDSSEEAPAAAPAQPVAQPTAPVQPAVAPQVQATVSQPVAQPQVQQAPVQPQAPVAPAPVAPTQPAAPQYQNFEATQPNGAPVDIAPSAAAKADIDDFYSSLE